MKGELAHNSTYHENPFDEAMEMTTSSKSPMLILVCRNGTKFWPSLIHTHKNANLGRSLLRALPIVVLLATTVAPMHQTLC